MSRRNINNRPGRIVKGEGKQYRAVVKHWKRAGNRGERITLCMVLDFGLGDKEEDCRLVIEESGALSKMSFKDFKAKTAGTYEYNTPEARHFEKLAAQKGYELYIIIGHWKSIQPEERWGSITLY